MKRSKLIVCGALLLVLGAAGTAALDWGGTVDNTTAYLGEGDWDQQDKLALWLAADLGSALTLEAQGSYTWSLDRPYLFDLDRLVLAGRFPGVLGESSLLRINAGRIPLRDPTGTTLDITADGLAVALGLPRVSVGLAAAYTGLLLKPVANVTISTADQTDQQDDSIIWAPKRLVGQLEVRLPELFLRQTLTAAALLQQDLRADEAARLSTQYFLVGLGGPLVSGFYYDASATLSTGQDAAAADSGLLGLLVQGGVRYFNQRVMYSRVELRGSYATGDSGPFDAYRPVSRPTLGLVHSPSLGDLLRVEASGSIKPFADAGVPVLENLQTLFKATGFYSGTDRSYLGAEFESGINYRPLADLGLALAAGVWAPTGGAPQQTKVKLDVSFAF